MKHSLEEGSSYSQTPQLLHKNTEFTLRGANSRALSAERGKDIVLVVLNRTVLIMLKPFKGTVQKRVFTRESQACKQQGFMQAEKSSSS